MLAVQRELEATRVAYRADMFRAAQAAEVAEAQAAAAREAAQDEAAAAQARIVTLSGELAAAGARGDSLASQLNVSGQSVARQGAAIEGLTKELLEAHAAGTAAAQDIAALRRQLGDAATQARDLAESQERAVVALTRDLAAAATTGAQAEAARRL